MPFTLAGVRFVPIEWLFGEDGFAGGIYFEVPAGTFVPDSNNGASAQDEVDDAGRPYQRVRCATPCMTDEDPRRIEVGAYLRQAAEFALGNLRRA